MASGFFSYAEFQIIVVSLVLDGYWPERIAKPLALKTTISAMAYRRFGTGRSIGRRVSVRVISRRLSIVSAALARSVRIGRSL
jgi:hypothetical protein